MWQSRNMQTTNEMNTIVNRKNSIGTPDHVEFFYLEREPDWGDRVRQPTSRRASTVAVVRYKHKVRVGIAHPGPGEPFSRRIGRNIALGRATHYHSGVGTTFSFGDEEEARGFIRELKTAYHEYLTFAFDPAKRARIEDLLDIVL